MQIVGDEVSLFVRDTDFDGALLATAFGALGRRSAALWQGISIWIDAHLCESQNASY